MSEPEIARRCLNCGASVRGAAHFCPQCGRPMASVSAQGATAERPALVEEAERVASSVEDRLAARAREERRGAEAGARVERATARPAPETDVTNTAAPSTILRPGAAQSSSATQPPEEDERRSRDARAPGEASAGGVRARAAAVGAGVSESVRPRVERLRERSVVVLDEAADDPGLRFVLVAAALFFVALLIFVFSFVLR